MSIDSEIIAKQIYDYYWQLDTKICKLKLLIADDHIPQQIIPNLMLQLDKYCHRAEKLNERYISIIGHSVWAEKIKRGDWADKSESEAD